ncbi:unnamed protein product [Strongylus vulgaris]|uniref:Uncharacterized protein n=1 Tax=Strongylus vulgaris TaxID=40348 RepID=A0A3P7IEQ1_STRVU|nr:unnamed protein product [Strongylus vulgaris]
MAHSSFVVKRIHHGTLEALDLSHTHMLSVLSIRMHSYHLAWLSFDSVLRIRRPSPYSTAILQHPADDSELDAFYEDLEEVIRLLL